MPAKALHFERDAQERLAKLAGGVAVLATPPAAGRALLASDLRPDLCPGDALARPEGDAVTGPR